MEKKNIIFLMESMEKGGAEKILPSFLNMVDFTAYKVTLMLYWNTGLYLKEVPREVTVEYLFKNRGILSRFFLRISKYKMGCALLALIFRYKRKKYDICISFMEGIPLLIQNIFHFSQNNIAWVHTDLISDHWTSFFFRNNIESNYFNINKKILFVSDLSLQNFEIKFPNVNAQLEVFHNPIDKTAIMQKSVICDQMTEELCYRSNHKFRIVTLGRLSYQKAYHRLIDAVSILKMKGYDLELLILGEGPLLSELENQREALGLQEYIRFIGFKENPYPILRSANLFVSTSSVEGFSLVICEALCLEVPVLATKTAGAIEILENQYGYLVEHSSESIAFGIEQLLIDRELYARLKEKAKERGDKFDLNSLKNQLNNLFEEILICN